MVHGFGFLAHHPSWTIAKTHLSYSAVVTSPVDPEALVLQDRPLHALQQLEDGVDAGVN